MAEGSARCHDPYGITYASEALAMDIEPIEVLMLGIAAFSVIALTTLLGVVFT